MPCFPRSALAALPVIALLPLGACSSGGNNESANTVVGATGGQVLSSDGLLRLDVPAGALTGPEDITIQKLSTGDVDPALAPLGPVALYRLTPDGLVFAQPVTVTFDAGAPDVNMPGTVATDLLWVANSSAGTHEAVDGLQIVLDASAGTLQVSGEISHFSDVTVLKPVPSTGATVEVTYPSALANNLPAPVTGRFTQPVSSQVSTGEIHWFAQTNSVLTSSIEGPPSVVFDAGGLLPGMLQTLENMSTVSCDTVGGGELTVAFALEALEPPFLSAGPHTSVDVQFENLSITCDGGVPIGPVLYPVPTLANIEAVRLVNSPASCGSTPSLLIGGEGGSSLMDPATGDVLEEFLATGTFYDAMYFPPPNPGDDGGVFMSGLGLLFERLDDSCETGVFAQTGANTILDATYAGNDPALGGHFAGPGTIGEIVFQPLSSGWEAHDLTVPVASLPSGFRSVKGNITGTKFLALGAFLLSFIDGNDAGATASTAFFLGSNPRRVRWDPTSGFGAVSDLDDDTLTVFTWDGEAAPVQTDLVVVGEGPVGLDVMGNRIVCAGFYDSTYTIVTLDGAGVATQVDINPSPFVTGALNAGHAIFIGDASNSIAVSYFGSGEVAVIPNAF